jgi:hypothetical protein
MGGGVTTGTQGLTPVDGDESFPMERQSKFTREFREVDNVGANSGEDAVEPLNK